MSVALNEKIRAKKVRLIDEQGNNLGEVEKQVALDHADKVEMDLVQMNEKDLPVCKVMDFSKYQYEKKKKEKKNKKEQHTVKWKEYQLSIGIADHDLEVKARKASKAVLKGDKAKVVLILKGRQINNVEFAKGVLEKFKQSVSEGIVVEKDVFLDGKRLMMHLGKSE